MKIFYIIFCVILSLHFCTCSQINFEAFTHPVSLDEIPVYSTPGKFYSYLQSDAEAGWIIKIEEKKMDYFYVRLPSDCALSLKEVWIKSGDIGIVIQNYDSIKIPMYMSADALFNPITYIYTSTVGRIYDVKKDLVLLSIMYDNKEVKGWVEKKYLCGNPYTTCN